MNLNKLDGFLRSNVKVQRDLAEANNLLLRLKQDVKSFRDTENNLRNQLIKTQDRNIALQRDLNIFKSTNDKMREQQEKIRCQENEIIVITKKLNDLKSAVMDKIRKATNEEELEVKVAALQKKLNENDAQLSLIKIEHQMRIKEKEKENSQLEAKLEGAIRELEKTRLDCDMAKNELDRIHLTHSKQIMNYETTIRNYEKERHLVLGISGDSSTNYGTNLPKKTDCWDKSSNVTWADSARKTLADRGYTASASYRMKPGTIQEVPETSNYSEELPQKRNFPGYQAKTKTIVSATIKPMSAEVAPLDIVLVKDNDCAPPSKIKKKKRLYSSNNELFEID